MESILSIIIIINMLLLLIALGVFGKKHLVTVTSVLGMIVCVVLLYTVQKQIGFFSEEAQDAEIATEEEYIRFSYSLMLAGDYLSAENVLKESQEIGDNRPAYLLARARAYALRGDATGAKCLYEQIEKDSGKTVNAKHVETEKIASYAFLEDGDINDFSDVVRDNIEEEIGENNYKEEAECIYAICKITKEAEDGEGNAAETESAVKNLRQGIDRIRKENPAIMDIPTVRSAIIEYDLMTDNYKQLVEEVDDSSNGSEFLAIAELYRQRKITKQLLKKNEHLEKISQAAGQSLEWIEKQCSKHKFSEEELDILEQFIEKLRVTADDPAEAYVMWLKSKLQERAEDSGETDQAKLLLQLSRIAYEEGNESKSRDYLRRALDVGNESTDYSFVGPISKIKETISDQENKESLKSIDGYVDMMVDNMQSDLLKNIGMGQTANSSAYSNQVTDLLEDAEEVKVEESDQSHIALPETEENAYSSFVADQVSQLSAAVNIASIDASEFEKVTAIVTVDETIAKTEEEFKENFRVLDCDIEIGQYEIRKLTNEQVNIVLCCDNSGSMQGQSIEDLKGALTDLVNLQGMNANIGVVVFRDGIDQEHTVGMGAGISELNDLIQSMQANGGTDIYEGVQKSIGMFSEKKGVNVVILMSDGQDSEPNADRMYELKELCEDLNLQIYSMGLGSDVDANVLSSYSDTTGGNYAYVSNSKALSSFYNYLFRLSQNRYEITYQAVDTLTASRELTVEYRGDRNIYDVRGYNLYADIDLLSENQSGLKDKEPSNYKVSLQDAVVGGFDTKLLYKSAVDQEICLLGNNLKNEYDIQVSIHAGTEYDLEAEYIDDTRWKVTVPSRVACGNYDVYVMVKGKRAVLESGLIIADDNLHVVSFDDYVFTSTGILILDESIEMTGYIRMNDWLGFSGTVTIDGDVKRDSEVTVSWEKSYVQYKKSDSPKGFASYLADKGMSLSMPAVTGLTLYRNDLADYTSEEGLSEKEESENGGSENYRVDHYTATNYGLIDLFDLPSCDFVLYPDRAEINILSLGLKLPFLDSVMKGATVRGTTYRESLLNFSFETESVMIINDQAVGLDLAVQYADKNEMFHAVQFGRFSLKLCFDTFDLRINTFDGDGHLELVSKIFPTSDSGGFRIGWKNMSLDTVILKYDHEFTFIAADVPITVSDFSMGVTNFSKEPGDDLSDRLKNMALQGSCDVSVAKVSALLPGLENWVGDAALVGLDDITLKLFFGKMNIEAEGNFQFIGISLGNISLKAGAHLSYTNLLLGMKDEDVWGIILKQAIDLSFELHKSNVRLKAEQELAVTNKVMDLIHAYGEAELKLRLWVITKDIREQGEVFIGLYQQHNGRYVFAVMAGSNGVKHINAVWGGDTSLLSTSI